MLSSLDQLPIEAGLRAANRRPPAASRPRWCQSAWPLVLALLVLLGNPANIRGQDVINREYTIKAAYLYNLGRYVTWPQNAFADQQSPFVIGVLEPDFVGPDLQKIAEVKTIDNRPILVRKFSRPEDVQRCHILFLPRGVEVRIQRELIRRLSGSHILLVGETEEFLDHGGAIAFVVRENNVRLVIALEAAQREKLQVSSKLLQIALPKL